MQLLSAPVIPRAFTSGTQRLIRSLARATSRRPWWKRGKLSVMTCIMASARLLTTLGCPRTWKNLLKNGGSAGRTRDDQVARRETRCLADAIIRYMRASGIMGESWLYFAAYTRRTKIEPYTVFFIRAVIFFINLQTVEFALVISLVIYLRVIFTRVEHICV